MKKINENGRSMVEMLGVLAIIGVLSVGGIAGYSKAMNKFKINKMNDQMSMLIANIRTMFATQVDYDGLENSSAKTFGLIPKDMYQNINDSTIKNPYNGEVEIKTVDYRTTANGAFYIMQKDIPNEACVSIVTNDWGSDTASGLIGIGVGDQVPASDALDTPEEASNGKAYGVPGGYNDNGGGMGTPYKVTGAQTACSSATDQNTIYWVYY